jgi:hypothetical protein
LRDCFRFGSKVKDIKSSHYEHVSCDGFCVGDYVVSMNRTFIGRRRVLDIRKTQHSDGNAITLEGLEGEYWSRYLRKAHKTVVI